MASSILNDIKHNLNLLESDTEFDGDVMMHINSALATLTQLGVGPRVGYMITNAGNQWEEFFSDVRLNSAKSYVFLSVKMMFDGDASGPVLQARQRQLDELVFRLTVVADYG